MSRSGLWSQLGLAVESTVGTYATPTRFLEMVEESLQLEITRDESQGLRSATRSTRADRWVAGRRSVGGDVVFEVADRGFGLPLAYAFGGGTFTTSTPSGGTNTRDHLIEQTLNYGRALTIQVGRPGTAGTVHPFDYVGCKVTEATLSSEVDDFLRLSMTVSGIDERTGGTLAAVSYPSTQTLLSWVGGTFSVGGSALDVKAIEFTVNHGLDEDRYFLRSGGTLRKEHIEAGMAEATGSLTVEFENLTQYNRYINGTTASLAGTWAGSTIEGTLAYSCILNIPVCRFDGETPVVAGPDILELEVPFKALVSSAGASPYQIRYRTTDTEA